MAQKHQIYFPHLDFTWIDIVDPGKDEILNLARDFDWHETTTEDCLEPEHLPKYEIIAQTHFLIVRFADEKAPNNADTLFELTRKVAIFFTERHLITVHRSDLSSIESLRRDFQDEHNITEMEDPKLFLLRFLTTLYESFDKAIEKSLDQLDVYEAKIFGTEGSSNFSLQHIYHLKRVSSVYRRVIKLGLESTSKLISDLNYKSQPESQDLKDILAKLGFYADELLESTTSLVSLCLSMESQKINEASQKTNDVMRLLTVFSVFFLPLNFLASIYGMNFEYMPELRWHYGYPMILVAMFFIASSILLGMRYKGWLTGLRRAKDHKPKE